MVLSHAASIYPHGHVPYPVAARLEVLVDGYGSAFITGYMPIEDARARVRDAESLAIASGQPVNITMRVY